MRTWSQPGYYELEVLYVALSTGTAKCAPIWVNIAQAPTLSYPVGPSISNPALHPTHSPYLHSLFDEPLAVFGAAHIAGAPRSSVTC